ncbi:outer membrane protein [Paracoccaceae bacterium GXU_MW_L88]
MKKFALFAGAALIAGTAHAGNVVQPEADPVVVAPAPVVTPAPVATPDSNWSGFYLGAQVGYADGDFQLGDNDDSEQGFDGALGGVHAGYNYDFGKFVLGGELAYDKAALEFEDNDENEITDVATVKVRAGYDAGRWMPYVTAGAAYAQAEVADEEYEDWGYLAGAGVDFKATERMIVGVEATHNRFEEFDDTEFEGDFNAIKLKASYRF